MKQILVNASQKEEMRLAVVENKELVDLDIEAPSKNTKSNIYKGIISRVEPSLEAAFVNYGRTRHGFLPFKEISNEVFTPKIPRSSKDCLKPGKEIVVQVDREERGSKGAALTTHLTLAGKYLVLLPKNPNTGGISRRLEGPARLTAKKLLNSIKVPDGMSVILRTSGLDSTAESLQWDIDYLIQIYESILENSVLKQAPFLIYQESNILQRLIRDYIDEKSDEVIIDNQEFYDKFLISKEHFIPHLNINVTQYKESIPLFSKFRIESQIQTVYKRKVALPSGGNVVFDQTEALTSIDVNSAKSTRGGDIEETALNTNLEAVSVISSQLKLRDIGGLIVIDFIDMMSINSQKNVMRKMGEASKYDKAKIQLGRISKFGLLELSRQKLKSTLLGTNNEICPTCAGSGQIKSLTTLTISFLRILEEEAMKASKSLTVYLPVRLATYLLNEKKDLVQDIENRQSVTIKVIPDPDLEGSNYNIDKQNLPEDEYKMSVKNSKFPNKSNHYDVKSGLQQKPMIESIIPKTAPPKPTKSKSSSSTGLFTRIMRALFGQTEKKVEKNRSHYHRGRRYNRYGSYKYNKYKSYNRKKKNYNNASSKTNSSK
ncbi:MAG: Rne/Rng family ribonuclease [Pseudomonadota bacterium]|nr:Rne/Rng family ribonuclease [Pseudomonadota bacterium]